MVKLRWTPRQLKAGINNGVLLEDALKDDMSIKLDFVIEIDGQFVEVSEIYTTKYQTKKPLKQVEDELEADVAHYAKENNSMKALKRFFSLLMLHSGHDRVKKELVLFFNSEVGLANKICNDLELLHSIRKHITPEQYRNAVQSMKQRASVVVWINASKFDDSVPKVIRYLRRKISPFAKNTLKHLT